MSMMVKQRTTSCMEKTVLTVLMALFGAMAAVLTLLSQPGAEQLAVCGVVVILCGAGVLALHTRPMWQAELTEEGIQCREKRGGEMKLLDWSVYRRAYELRTYRGDGCLMLATGVRTRSELVQAYRHCAVTGSCAYEGCVCIPGRPGEEALAILARKGVRAAQEPLQIFLL